MTLVKETIKSQIIAAQQGTENEDPEKAADDFADKLADIMINAIKSATVTIGSGLVVTVGSATTQSNAAPIVVTGGIS